MPRGVLAAGVSLGETCRRCGRDEWKFKSGGRGKTKARYCAPCARTTSRTRQQEAHREDPTRKLWHDAKSRAKRKKLIFNLTADDVERAWPNDGRCPVLGIRLTGGDGAQHDASPTLDRLNSEWGYEVGNIAIMSARANRIKSNGSAAEHEQIAEWMKSRGLS